MPVRVFVSYSHDNDDHKTQVLRFCGLLREHGIDARVDRYDTDVRRDWYAWIIEQITAADYVLAIASSDFRHAADGNAEATRNRGVQTEAALLRDLLHGDRPTWTRKLLPIVLPGNTIDQVPHFLQPYCADHYMISALSRDGIEGLLRTITGQPSHPKPELGDVPVLPPEHLESIPGIDATQLARQLRRLDPGDGATELAGFAPADTALVLRRLYELDKVLAGEILDETDPTVAAKALHKLVGLMDDNGYNDYMAVWLVGAMRPECAARLLIMIREGRAVVPPGVAVALLVEVSVGKRILNSMDPAKAAALLLDVFDEDMIHLSRLLSEMERARAVAVLAGMTHEQAADLLTGVGYRYPDKHARLLMAMTPELRTSVLNVMGPDVAARALEELAPADAEEILRALPESQASRVARRIHPDYARKMRVDKALAKMRPLDPAAASTVLTGLSLPDAAVLLDGLDNETAAEVLDEIEPGPAAAILHELRRPEMIMPLMRPERVARVIVAVHQNRTDQEPDAVRYYLHQLTHGSGGPVLDAMDTGQVATMLVAMSQPDPGDQPAQLLEAMTPNNAVEVVRRMGAKAAAGLLNNSYVAQLADTFFTHLTRVEVAGIVGWLSTNRAVLLLSKMEPDAVAKILSAVPGFKADRLRRHVRQLPGFERMPVLPPDSAADEDLDAEGIARRFSRLDPEDTAAELAELTPPGAARVLNELNELGADLAAELIDETEPAFAAQVLHELADLRDTHLPSRLLALMRPGPAALLLVMIRQGRAGVAPELATSLLTSGDGVPVPDGMDPDKAAALLLGVLYEEASGLPRVLRSMKPAWIVTVLARMTREQAADVLTTNGDGRGNAVVLMAMPPDLRTDVLGLMRPTAAATALAELAVTDTAEALRHLPESRVDRLVRRFPADYVAKLRAGEALAQLSQGKPADLTGISASDAVHVLRELAKTDAAKVLEEAELGFAATLLAEALTKWHLIEIPPAMRPERLGEIVLAIHEGRTHVEPHMAPLLLCHFHYGVDGQVLDALDTDQAASILVALSQLETQGRLAEIRGPYILEATTRSRAVETIRRMGAEQTAVLFNRGYQQDIPRVAAALFTHLKQAEIDEIVGFMNPGTADRLQEQ